jgi:hypothetical protein
MKDWNIIERDFIEWDNSTHSNASQRQILDWFKEHLIPESGQTNEEYLAECIEKAEPNLSKIKDVDKELAEIRGENDEFVKKTQNDVDKTMELAIKKSGKQKLAKDTITNSDIEAWAEETVKNIPDETKSLVYYGRIASAKAHRDNEIKHIG